MWHGDREHTTTSIDGIMFSDSIVNLRWPVSNLECLCCRWRRTLYILMDWHRLPYGFLSLSLKNIRNHRIKNRHRYHR